MLLQDKISTVNFAKTMHANGTKMHTKYHCKRLSCENFLETRCESFDPWGWLFLLSFLLLSKDNFLKEERKS